MKELEFFRHYWAFFGQTRFTDRDILTLFGDGSFAIKSDCGITLFDKSCKLIKEFNAKAFVLPDGGIGVWVQDKNCVDVYKRGKKSYCLNFGNQAGRMDWRIHNLVFGRVDGKTESVYLLGAKEARQLVLPDGFEPAERHLWKTSANGMVFAKARDENGKFHSVLLDETGRDISAAASRDTDFRVSFMKCGAYIAGSCDGYVLFNAKHERLLASFGRAGIVDYGGWFVRYEDGLIVSAAGGSIFGKCGREIAVAPGGMRVFPYTLEGLEGVGYWLGGKFEFSAVNGIFVMSYFHDGRFFMIPLGCPAAAAGEILFALEDKDSDFAVYKDRIWQMLLRK